MIAEYYQNPNPVVRHVVAYSGPIYSDYEKKKAEERKITPWQWRDRCDKVRKAYAACKHKVGDVVYPHNEKLLKQYGQMLVQAVCMNYDNYGDTDWNDPPYILQVAPVEDLQTSVSCTADFVQKENPVKEVVC